MSNRYPNYSNINLDQVTSDPEHVTFAKACQGTD